MSRSLRLLALVSLFFAALTVPARAQSFIMHTADTISPGDLRFTAFPVGLFSRSGGPDRWGGAGLLGYGITDRVDIEGQGAVFDGFSLVGLNTNVWVFRGDVDLSGRVGVHKALVTGAPNSTAVDLSTTMGGRVSPSLRVSGGVTVSFESLDDVRRSTNFHRVYAVPGVEYRINRNLDFIAEFGAGLNHDSPHYLTAGFAVYMPVTDAARNRDRR
jgi:hypothetical protein